MALPRDVYRELEDILGSENISEDLAVLDGYAYQWPGELMGAGRFTPRAGAVVLPGNTEEVQAIIKLCNRRGIQSKASSTGYGVFNALGSESAIQMDLRRMNRILEIDEKNMYIVVEPYVSFAQVQAEAMKRGLNCHVISAGSQCSFLASHTSMQGSAAQAHSLGMSGRNLLGAEWVLPTGEVVKVGSLGSGAGWFSGDGPGPSLRGIIRGSVGSCGGLGVFTKCACHLHPWPGPSVMEVKGVSPEYETEIPEMFKSCNVAFPDPKKFTDAAYKISEAGIAYVLHHAPYTFWQGAYATTSNNEFWDKYSRGELEAPKWTLSILLAANSPREHEYQVNVLEKILDETGGKILVTEDPNFIKRNFLNTIKVCHISRQCYRLTGSFFESAVFAMDSIDHSVVATETDEEPRKRYIEKGVIMDDGTDNNWMLMFEGGHYAETESLLEYDPTNPESVMGAGQYMQEGLGLSLQKPLNASFFAMGPFLPAVGPACGNYQNWMRKIKKAFDPNAVSDPSMYISAEEE